MAELTGEGPHLLTVSGYDDSDGSFEVVTDSCANSRNLPRAMPVTTPAPAVFDVDVDTGQLFGFTVEPTRPDSVLTIQVNGPDGFASGFTAGTPVPGEPATAIIDGGIPGAYRIIVASADMESEIIATLLPLEPQTIGEDAPVTTSAPAVFDRRGERRTTCSPSPPDPSPPRSTSTSPSTTPTG